MADTTNPADDSGYDILKEDLITFAQAARMFPKVGGKKHVSLRTMHRWARKGCRSQKARKVWLEYAIFGGEYWTSIQALVRFSTRLRDDDPPETPCTPSRPEPSNTPGTLKQDSPEKRAEQATKILRRRGIIK
jgi:hypothetical protein